MLIVAGGMLAATSCSDYTDYNTVPEAADPAADKTLWENISANSELSDFAAVLQRVGYDKVLDASHTYTVWAPVNGSFSMDSLANVSDEKVVKEFLNNLIADYAHRETDPNDTLIFMLNEKLLKFSYKNTASLSFDAKKVLPNATNAAVFNYPSTNGLLYLVSAPATFRYNGYEYIFDNAGLADSLKAYVERFHSETLDEAASVKGVIKDGVQHYDDSVMIVSNLLLDQLKAQLENEDSLYTIVVPTDEAWVKAYEKIASYYKYIPSIAWQDLGNSALEGKKGADLKAADGTATATLATPPTNAPIQETAAYWTDSISKRAIITNLFFSENNKYYNGKLASGAAFGEDDTLYTTSRKFLTGLQALDAATVEVKQLSNGHARIVNEFPFLPEETYVPVIRTNEAARCVTNDGYGAQYYSMTRNLVPDSICQLEEDEEYLRFVEAEVPEGSNFAAELDFYLPNVRSTTYDVSAVIVPGHIFNQTKPAEERKPLSLYFDISYTNASNKQIIGRFDGEKVVEGAASSSAVKKVKPFEVAKDKVDTVKLGRITFPICYVNTGANPNIKVQHSFKTYLSSQKKKYEQVLRVANIILEPVMVNEEDEKSE